MIKSRWCTAKYTLVCILLIAAALKVILLFSQSVPFNADEAVVGLMARHILLGERPVFFYGQAYMGSLDAYLVAAGMLVFGAKVWVMRVIQLLLYLATLYTTYLIGVTAFYSKKTGILATALLAIPTVNVTLYTTVTIGGYGEALLIGNCIFLITLRIAKLLRSEQAESTHPSPITWLWFGIFGFLAGLGLWTLGLTLVYSLPAGLYLLAILIKMTKKQRFNRFLPLILIIVGVVLGSFPWWWYAFQNGFQALIGELLGGAVAVEGGSFLSRAGAHLFNLIALGLSSLFGLRPPWGVKMLALPLAPIALAFWLASLILAGIQLRRKELPPGYILWGGAFLLFSLAFIFTPFGVDPSGRYFLPIGVGLALFGGRLLEYFGQKTRFGSGAVLVAILLFNLWGTIQCAMQNPPGITTQFNPETDYNQADLVHLESFLEEKQVTKGYTTYWVAYPLAFLSDEQLVFVPRLPYHIDLRYTIRDDRYAVYGKKVEESQQAAYITVAHPVLDEKITRGFLQAGITWNEQQIGMIHVFYNLSRKISPTDIPDIYADP